MELVLFTLACYGATQILVYGRVFDRIRPKAHFFHCTMCVGFWVGLFVALFFFSINPFLGACVSSGTSYALNVLFGDEGLNIKT